MYWATPNITTVKSNTFRTCILWINCAARTELSHIYKRTYSSYMMKNTRDGGGNLPPCHQSQSPTFKNDTLACVLVLDDRGAKTCQKLQRCNACIYWLMSRYVTRTQHGDSCGTHCFHSRVSLFKTASSAASTEVTAVFTLSIQNQSTHTINSLRNKKDSFAKSFSFRKPEDL